MANSKYSIRPIATAAFILIATMLAYVAADECPLNIPGAAKTRVGIYIEDLRTGDVIADVNADKLFTPASVTKSLTSATALSELMPTGQFTTTVQAIGKISGGTLDGNVVVQVIGDPTIESRHFPLSLGFADSIASGLRRNGIKEIAGSVVIDETLFADATVPAGWDKADLNYSYGAVLRGANFRGNSSGKSAVANPAAQMRSEIIKALAAAGISVGNSPKGTVSTDTKTLYTHLSPKVYDILHSLMIRSDNLYAEGMLRALDPYRSRDEVLDYEQGLWESRGVDFSGGISVNDGSGLSRYNKFSPKFMASVYRWMYNSPMRREYSDLFPRAGQEGTMRNFLKDTRLSGLLAMKTGSMSGVQGFGGYLCNRDGEPTHIVVVFVNDFTCGRDALKREIAAYLLKTLP